YVADSDLDEDLKEDHEHDHANYPADGWDGDDEPFDDDDDDDTDDEDEEPFEDEEDDEEQEEEHLASVESSVVPIVDHVLPAIDIEALEADEPAPTPRSPYTIIPISQTRLRRAQKTVKLEPPISASIKACIATHVALFSPPLPVPAVEIRMRALLPSTSRKTDIPEADVPPRKRACLTTLALGSEVGESSTTGATRQPGPIESDLRRCRVEQTGYRITETWDEIVDTLIEIAPTTLEGDDRAVLRARVNTLFGDRPDHHHTTMLLDREAMYAHEAWTGFKDRSAAIAGHIRTLKAHVAALIA
nr:hypothetical protein [Tanacetum cinerariifolium]